jgi:hypothetical protein
MVTVSDVQLSGMFFAPEFLGPNNPHHSGIYLDDFYLKASADYNLNPGPVEYKA